MAQHYDIAIVGGGLVGASLACALSTLNLRVAVLEAVKVGASKQPSYDDRTLALSASSCAILDTLGLWQDLKANATPIREIQVREWKRPGLVIMDPGELGLDCFGNVVEARVFGAAVMQRLPTLENVDFLCPAKVEQISFNEDSASIAFRHDDESTELTTSLVVGADGARSLVRDAAGIDSEQHDYGQTAVICNVTPELNHGGTAYECFTPTGPFAVMPHVEGRCGLIWCVETALAPGLLDLEESEFLRLAQQRFGNHLGEFLKVGRRSSYPLKLVRAQVDIAQRVVLLGNAAHAIHPIGAQGFNLGLRDAAVLSEVVADHLEISSADGVGSSAVLQRYSEWRRADQDGTINYSDGMARLFSNDSPLAAGIRTLGLAAHALFPPLRRQMAVKAMGYRGRTPRLAAGEPL